MIAPEVLPTASPYTPCQTCKAGHLAIDEETTIRYFDGQKVICPNCQSLIDWWEQILWQIQCGFDSLSLAPAGAVDTWIRLKMKPGQISKVDLNELGLPTNVRILRLGYTAQGLGLIPTEIHSNVPTKHFIPRVIHLYGRPFNDEPQSEIDVLVSVLWVPISEDEEAWNNLVTAFEVFLNKSYDSVIIPANVAVESKLTRVLFEALRSVASKERIDSFLSDAATYGHQLNVLLPLITKFLEMPSLPDHIRGILNRLRKCRNTVSHEGKLSIPTTARHASEYLCAAFFTFVYLKDFEQRILALTQVSKRG